MRCINRKVITMGFCPKFAVSTDAAINIDKNYKMKGSGDAVVDENHCKDYFSKIVEQFTVFGSECRDNYNVERKIVEYEEKSKCYDECCNFDIVIRRC